MQQIQQQSEQTARSQIRSIIFKRRHSEIANYLINDIGIENDAAHLLLQVHQPQNINEAINLFLTDQSGFINHLFIPKGQNQHVCIICEATPQQHLLTGIRQLSEEVQQQIQASERESFHTEIIENEQPRVTCEICYVEVRKSEILSIRGQAHNICLQCMDSYIKEEVGNMKVQRIACPHCGVSLPQDLIRDLTDNSTFAKYTLFIRNLQINKSPNLKWCPNPKCSIVVSTNPKKKTSKCPKCTTEICNKCNREAHPKSSCQGAFQKQIADWQNASDIQKCRKCQGLVQKIAGCNHMTCSVCHYQWCWLCGSPYSRVHFSNINPFGCPGLQNGPRDNWGKCKIIFLRIGILLLLILGAPLLIPIAMLASGPVLIGTFLMDYCDAYGCCRVFWVGFLAAIIGVPLDPIVWVGCIFYFIPLGIMKLWSWWKERREREQDAKDFLQERLIGEEVFQQK